MAELSKDIPVAPPSINSLGNKKAYRILMASVEPTAIRAKILPLMKRYGIAKVDIKENDVSKSKIINTKGEILVEELNISSFSKDFKYVYLHNSEQQYFRYNIKENKLEDLNENFITLNYFLNYSKGIYKDVDVY